MAATVSDAHSERGTKYATKSYQTEPSHSQNGGTGSVQSTFCPRAARQFSHPASLTFAVTEWAMMSSAPGMGPSPAMSLAQAVMDALLAT